MKSFFFRIAGLLAAVVLTAGVAAGSTALESMQAARQLRVEIAASVASGAETTAGALERLVKEKDLNGLGFTSEADLAHGAMDIGLRLMALGRPDAAEPFFEAAETNFVLAATRANGRAAEKAQHLVKLATVRARYLGKVQQAAADIDEAIRLQPQDKALAEQRGALTRNQEKPFQVKPRG